MAHRFYEDGRIQAGLTPQQYHEAFTQQANLDPTTLNAEQAEMLEYTRLNLHRSQRIANNYKVSEDIAALVQAIDAPQTWLVLTEPWCGDSAQCLPHIARLAQLNANIDLRLLMRDDNLDVMDDFLTDGKRSIPRLVIFDAEGEELAQWGPRPAEAQVVFNKAKEAKLEKPEILERLHLFYGRNRGAAMEDEMRYLLSELVNR